MKVEYDREVSILYIKFKDSKIKETRMLCEDPYVDIDENGELWV